jgi:hypothetical protein
VESNRHLLQYIKNIYKYNNWEETYENLILQKISSFIAVLSKFWIKSLQNVHRFSEYNIDWLKKIFVMPPIIPLIPPPPTSLPSTSNVGRPQKVFSDCSDRSKRRKVLQLTKSYT